MRNKSIQEEEDLVMDGDKLSDCIQELSEENRQIMIWRVTGYYFEEIAELVHRTPSEVEQIVKECTAYIKRIYRERYL